MTDFTPAAREAFDHSDFTPARRARDQGLGTILDRADTQTTASDAVGQFVQFTTTLVTGLGTTLLYGMQLSFTATVDYMIGLVYAVQDLLYTFNIAQCTVPNYALRYVLRCPCGDTEHRIPHPQRGHGWRDGGLWCVGTLHLLLTSGDMGLVYNPYTLDELSAGLSGLTAYVECLAEHADPGECSLPPTENRLLPVLVAQGVEPIAVWGRCKSNYAQSAWDAGAGALFMLSASDTTTAATVSTSLASVVPADVAAAAAAWAASTGWLWACGAGWGMADGGAWVRVRRLAR